MKLSQKFKKYLALLFVIFFTACSTSDSNSLNENSKVNSQNTEDKQSFSPKLRLIRNEGWKVPMPTKRKKLDTRVSDFLSEKEEEVKVAITTFTPTNEFLFSNTPLSSEEVNHISDKMLKLKIIDEYKVKNRIFAYSVMVNEVESSTNPNNNSVINMPFGYRIVDFDGDGKFETMLTDYDTELKIPMWALN